jgi:hypothetical protein
MRDETPIIEGEWGATIPVDPGLHVVTVTADGRGSWRTEVRVTGDVVTVSVPLLTPVRPPDPLPSPSMTARQAGDSNWRTLGLVVSGAGAATLIAGVVIAVLSKENYDAARKRCPVAPRDCPTDAVSDGEAAFGLATGATITLVAGALALATGGAILLFSPSPKRRLALADGAALRLRW